MLLSLAAAILQAQAAITPLEPSIYFLGGGDRFPGTGGLTIPIADTEFGDGPNLVAFLNLTATRVCWSGIWRFYPLTDYAAQVGSFYGYQLINHRVEVGCANVSREVFVDIAAQRSLRPLGCLGDISQKCVSMYAEEYASGPQVDYNQFAIPMPILNVTIQPVKSFYMTAPTDPEQNNADDLTTVVKTFSGPNGEIGAGPRPCIIMDGTHPGDSINKAKSYYHATMGAEPIPFVSMRGVAYASIGTQCNSQMLIRVPSGVVAPSNGVVTIYPA